MTSNHGEHSPFLPFSPSHFSDELLSYAKRVNYQRLDWPVVNACGIDVYLRRDDLASEYYPGNKFYKLYYHLQQFKKVKAQALVSFGGAYSNHIHALAALGQQQNLPTVGIIRGHKPKILSPTLQDAVHCGMELYFLNKKDYQNKNIDSFSGELTGKYGTYYLIPEGGEGLMGVYGAQAIGWAISQYASAQQWTEYSVCCALGTGTTMAGIIAALGQKIPCLGFSVLKGEQAFTHKIDHYLQTLACEHSRWRVFDDYHCGGYAKAPDELLAFMQALENDNQLLLEPVYSAKMLWGIQALAQQGYWPKGTKLIAVHGGGVQGRRGYGLLDKLP